MITIVINQFLTAEHTASQLELEARDSALMSLSKWSRFPNKTTQRSPREINRPGDRLIRMVESQDLHGNPMRLQRGLQASTHIA